jgi:beta-glucanase (GH16 family)
MAQAIGTLCYAFVYALAVAAVVFGAPAQAGWPDNYHPYKDQIAPSYVPVWSDEFPLTWVDSTNHQHSGLNTDKWWTRYIYNNGTLAYLNNETERYRENKNHVIDHSTVQPVTLNQYATMHLTAKLGADGTTLESGMLRSKQTFIGGYFEAMMRLPPGLGIWPAWWLNSATRTSDGALRWPPEFDIMEHMRREGSNLWHTGGACRNGVTVQDCSFLSGTDSRCIIPVANQSGDGKCHDANFEPNYNYYYMLNSDGINIEPLNREFHVWSLLWVVTNYATQRGYMIIYFDGKPVAELNYNWVYDDSTPAGYAHILLNLAMGDPCCGGTIDWSSLPEGFEINYVRVYQDPAHKVMGTDTVGVLFCPAGGGC